MHIQRQVLASLGGLAIVAASTAAFHPARPDGAATVVRHAGFESFHKGSAGDGGANLYVSRRGRVQTINRFDLNGDGELDLVFTQDHNNVYTPDSVIYWNGPDG